MDVIIADDYACMSRTAADIFAAHIADKPTCVLGLATGSTPVGLYGELVCDCSEGKISFKNVSTFNLDEYRGLSPSHEQSYRYFMQKNLFDLVDIDPANTHVPDGLCTDAQAACNNYEKLIAQAGGIDIQLLGLGNNGHIGFNEPADSFEKHTHRVQLTDSTIQANSRLFRSADEVPREAFTMGVGTIMSARKIVLVANGEGKADIVARTILGPVTPQTPASILQFHPNTTVILDKEAAAKL